MHIPVVSNKPINLAVECIDSKLIVHETSTKNLV